MAERHQESLWTGTSAGPPRILVAAVISARRRLAEPIVRRGLAAGAAVLVLTADGEGPIGPPGAAHVDLLPEIQRVGVYRFLDHTWPREINISLGPNLHYRRWLWRRWARTRYFSGLRPWVTWRALRRRLGQLDVAQIDHVVALSQEAFALAWHLHRLNPDLTISNDIPDHLFERLGLPVPAA